MDKELFDQAIGEVPPSTVDLDAVIARERRAAWVRRGANPWVASAAAVVAVTIGVAVLLPGDGSGSGGGSLVGAQPSVRPSVPSTGPSTTAGPPQPCQPASQPMTPPTTTSSREEPVAPPEPGVARRLTVTLTSAVSGVLQPGTELAPTWAAEYPSGTPHGPLEAYYVPEPNHRVRAAGCEGYYMARANVIQGRAKGNLMVVIQRAAEDTRCEQSTEEISCDSWTTADGSTVVATTVRLEGGAIINGVQVSRPDGTGVMIQAENVADDAKTGVVPTSRTPPLDHKQLVEIAIQPGLTLTS